MCKNRSLFVPVVSLSELREVNCVSSRTLRPAEELPPAAFAGGAVAGDCKVSAGTAGWSGVVSMRKPRTAPKTPMHPASAPMMKSIFLGNENFFCGSGYSARIKDGDFARVAPKPDSAASSESGESKLRRSSSTVGGRGVGGWGVGGWGAGGWAAAGRRSTLAGSGFLSAATGRGA